ncbi:MAG: hypothetical protein HFH38_02730 [Lachnospiraceae bacterium]|jgi:hypothetical protein|nr:hypothetical protein [Lachnospiraceae bacterium]
MEKKIQDLYEGINFLGFNTTYHRNNNYVENCKRLVPKIQEFVQWFMAGTQPGIGREVYDNLVSILEDCETALREHDNVLMMDALEQGIAGYLEMFLTEEYFREKETAYVGGVKGEEP